MATFIRSGLSRNAITVAPFVVQHFFAIIFEPMQLGEPGDRLSQDERKVRTPKGSEPDNIREGGESGLTTSATENKPAFFER